jgi:hypothetical protein
MSDLGSSAATAIERACGFVVAKQSADGFWRDYALAVGASTAWVTAVVGYALSGAHGVFADDAALSRALTALRVSCRASGWGYNAAVATDADTTSWVVRWFARIKAPLPLEPIACLQAYLTADGGARTFACSPRFGRWAVEHADVTAVVGLAMTETGAGASELAPLRRWTLDQQQRYGMWTSFWWTFDAYCHAHMLEFLSGSGGIPTDVLNVSRGYLATTARAETSMEEANLLKLALVAGASADSHVSALLERQGPDGGWPPSRVLKVPDQTGASEDEAAFEDVNGLMSTAMSIIALTTFLSGDSDA